MDFFFLFSLSSQSVDPWQRSEREEDRVEWFVHRRHREKFGSNSEEGNYKMRWEGCASFVMEVQTSLYLHER
jgi:hypothetical protein